MKTTLSAREAHALIESSRPVSRPSPARKWPHKPKEWLLLACLSVAFGLLLVAAMILATPSPI